MTLRRIRLELARNAEFPEGSSQRGYEFVAPLTDDGHLDRDRWPQQRAACTVRRFWPNEDDQNGHLIHHRGDRWAFHYDGLADEDEEPIFRSIGIASWSANTWRSPSRMVPSGRFVWSR